MSGFSKSVAPGRSALSGARRQVYVTPEQAQALCAANVPGMLIQWAESEAEHDIKKLDTLSDADPIKKLGYERVGIAKSLAESMRAIQFLAEHKGLYYHNAPPAEAFLLGAEPIPFNPFNRIETGDSERDKNCYIYAPDAEDVPGQKKHIIAQNVDLKILEQRIAEFFENFKDTPTGQDMRRHMAILCKDPREILAQMNAGQVMR